ncbi:hypothetical protein APB34_10295 [Pseudomonas aeruginosa]|uniref:Uncharacterized protein n=1 Tax=Pseudomonas aeruginosa TaxID=287 RepID=A0A367M7V6_PSEAI|nr:hypothetical protein YH69_33815 [Pseudomonas aeruginosa]AXZ89044.1 hypothetical protein AM490_00050 [Pseudomonas aeruginosa]AZM87069.1 hypothetical protein EIP87_34210 [Pseudomonas aeruginosa]KAB0727909.1 hypothetical protein F7O90_18605 [Pseudomonas aeruginosa]KSD76335.1 hypothetical protein AO910_12000 [Pseudomonas aeruginosa]
MIRLAAGGTPLGQPIRNRCLVAEMRLPGVSVAEFQGWVGACSVQYRVEGVEHAEVISSVDEAMLVAGMLSAPLACASAVRVEPAVSGRADFCTAMEWGKARFGEEGLVRLLAWWAL